MPGETVRRAADPADRGAGPPRTSWLPPPPALVEGTRAAEDRYETALERFTALGAGDLDARIDAVLDDLGLGAAAGRPGDGDAVRGPGGEGGPGGHRAVAVRGHPARRAHQRPRLRRPRATSRRGSGAARGGMVIVSHDRRVPRADGLDRPRDSTSTTTRPGSTAAAGPATRRSGPPPVAGPRSPTSSTERTPVRSPRSGPNANASGPRPGWPARPGPPGTTTRPNATSGSTGPRSWRPRPARPSGPWPPSTRWRSRGRAGTSASPSRRRPAAGARGRPPGPGPSSTRGVFVLGPLDLEIAWGDRLGLTGANGTGKSTLVGALLGTVPLSAGERWLGSERGARGAGPGPASARRRAATSSGRCATGAGSRCPRPARSWPSSAWGPSR